MTVSPTGRFIDRPGYLTPGRVLPDGRVVDVVPLIMGTARVTISASAAAPILDDAW